MEKRRILASYNEKTITVYQAYNERIADQAVKLNTFGSEFNLERMTWIKPSFLWMMYRSGWGSKAGQERILAIDMLREGFDLLLTSAVLSTFDQELYGSVQEWKGRLRNSEVRCQWDPDRDIYGNPINRRAIQIGLKGSMVTKYVDNWIVGIVDITNNVHKWGQDIGKGNFDHSHLPGELEYRVDLEIQKGLGMI